MHITEAGLKQWYDVSGEDDLMDALSEEFYAYGMDVRGVKAYVEVEDPGMSYEDTAYVSVEFDSDVDLDTIERVRDLLDENGVVTVSVTTSNNIAVTVAYWVTEQCRDIRYRARGRLAHHLNFKKWTGTVQVPDHPDLEFELPENLEVGQY